MTPRRRLSPTQTIGPWSIAVLEEWSVSAWAKGVAWVGGTGSKRPLALLMHGPTGTRFHAPSGTPLDPKDIDLLLPGALADFLKTTGRDTFNPEDEEEDQ